MFQHDELQKRVARHSWWHKIPLPTADGEPIITPGKVDHCTPQKATTVFGIPESLKGAAILDVGAWDGYFSFLAEERGAADVMAIDPMRGCSRMMQTPETFELAKTARGSMVQFYRNSLTSLDLRGRYLHDFDIVFYFGVLYHTENVFADIQALFNLTRPGGFALIETAMSTRWLHRGAMWEFKRGFVGDPTNMWYPTEKGIGQMLGSVGFCKVVRIHISRDRSRATFKAFRRYE